MDKTFVRILITFCLIKECTCAEKNCSWSHRTCEVVNTCPITEDDKEKAEKIKNCNALIHLQNCSEPSQFKYHCVIDEDGDKFLEVCAPVEKILLGYCATFNLHYGRIEHHKNKTCDGGNFPCPVVYLSSDSYKYPSCYGLHDIETTTSSVESCTCSTSETTNIISLMGAITGVIIVFFLICTRVWCWRYKHEFSCFRGKRQRRRKKKEFDETDVYFIQRGHDEDQKKGKTKKKSPPLSRKNTHYIVVSDACSINHISHISSDIMWISDRKHIMETNRKGRTLCIYDIDDTRFSASHTITKNRALFFIKDSKVHSVSSKKKTTKTFLSLEWNVLSIYSSHKNGNLILSAYILTEEEFQSKLMKYSEDGELLLTIQHDEGKSLYSLPLYISENINMDICTTDYERNEVTVVNEFGKLQFSYKGQPSEDGFFPTGICNDNDGNIIVCNRYYANPSVHLLHMDGQFLKIVLTKEDGIKDPYGVFVDDDKNLYLGQHNSNILMVYKNFTN